MEAFLHQEGLFERIGAGMTAIFSRKPNAMTQLDGLRAIAVLWVFALHTVDSSYFWPKCFDTEKNTFNKWILAWPKAGELGVDMFFVLPGFLIAYILMKEHKKYDSIDIVGFFRGRFIRVWFVLALYCPIEFIVKRTSPAFEG